MEEGRKEEQTIELWSKDVRSIIGGTICYSPHVTLVTGTRSRRTFQMEGVSTPLNTTQILKNIMDKTGGQLGQMVLTTYA